MSLRSLVNATAVVAALIPASASALTSLVGMEAFTGSETVLNFDELTEGEIAADQYLALGVDFGANGDAITASTAAGILGEDIWFFFDDPGAAVLQNFTERCNLPPGCHGPLVIDFVVPQQLVGLDLLTNFGDSEFETVAGGTMTTITALSGSPESFIGWFDPAGIDRITITAPDNGAIGVNDLRFGLSAPSIPEPSAAVVFAIGCVVVGSATRRRAA